MLSPRRQAQFGLIAATFVFLLAAWALVQGRLQKPNLRLALVGSPAASFRLPDVDGKMVALSSTRGSVTVICFPPTPDAENSARDIKRLSELYEHFSNKSAGHGVRLLAVYGNTEDLTDAQLRQVDQRAFDAGPGCTTLLDPTGRISRAYRVEQTPTFFVLDSWGTIRYRGGIDDTSSDSLLASTSFTSLIDLLLAERPLPGQPTPAVLSNINK